MSKSESIDKFVKGELLVRFEKDVRKKFAQEFIGLLDYKILNDSKYNSKRSKGQMLIQVPIGKERETLSLLQNYKKIIKSADYTGKLQGFIFCKDCYEEVEKGDIYQKIIGEEKYLCFGCAGRSLADVLRERNIASLDP